MPVNAPHPAYSAALAKWTRARHVLGGEDTVKAAGQEYLPKLEGQEPAEYDAYVQRAQFFNATARTLDGFAGMIFRKPPVVKIPDAMKAFVDDCTMEGQSFAGYQKQVTAEVIGLARSGTLVEWNDAMGRAHLVRYNAEDIINWRMSRVNGKVMLSLVVLKERVHTADAQAVTSAGGNNPADPPEQSLPISVANTRGVTGPDNGNAEAAGDEFTPTITEQLRVLRLVPVSESEAWYEVECFQPDPNKKDVWRSVGVLVPSRRGKALEEIPFVFHGPNANTPDVDKLPLDDIIVVNLSHYRSSADLEHGRHFTALPTAWVAGFELEKGDTLRIGSTTAWISSNPNAKAEYLEFTGQGLKALETALTQKEAQMAVLGARMLEGQKREAETAEAMQTRQAGEVSVIVNIARSLGEAFTKILRIVAWWNAPADQTLEDAGKDIIVEMNTDFVATKMDAPTILAIVKAWQAGAMTKDSMLYAFKQGELLRPDRSPEEELAALDTEELPETGDPLRLDPDEEAKRQADLLKVKNAPK